MQEYIEDLFKYRVGYSAVELPSLVITRGVREFATEAEAWQFMDDLKPRAETRVTYAVCLSHQDNVIWSGNL